MVPFHSLKRLIDWLEISGQRTDRLIACLLACLGKSGKWGIDWVIVWLINCLFVHAIDWLFDVWSADRSTDWLIYSSIDWLTGKICVWWFFSHDSQSRLPLPLGKSQVNPWIPPPPLVPLSPRKTPPRALTLWNWPPSSRNAGSVRVPLFSWYDGYFAVTFRAFLTLLSIYSFIP